MLEVVQITQKGAVRIVHWMGLIWKVSLMAFIGDIGRSWRYNTNPFCGQL